MAMKAGVSKAERCLLEPIMKVEVVTPEDYMGDVVGDLNRRRGMIEGMEEIRPAKSSRGSAAGGDVWLFDGSAFGNAGSRDVTRWNFRSIRSSPTGSLRGSSKASNSLVY